MLRINKVRIEDYSLEIMTNAIRYDNWKRICIYGSLAILDFIIFLGWIYEIVVSGNTVVNVCIAMFTGFAAAYTLNITRKHLMYKRDLNEAVKFLFDSDLALMKSGKSCAFYQNDVCQYALADFGSVNNKLNIVEELP